MSISHETTQIVESLLGIRRYYNLCDVRNPMSLAIIVKVLRPMPPTWDYEAISAYEITIILIIGY